MQGRQVWSWSRRILHATGQLRPRTTPTVQRFRICTRQLQKPRALCSTQEKPPQWAACTRQGREAPLTAARGSLEQQWRPGTAKNTQNLKNNSDNTKCWQGCGEVKPSKITDRNIKWYEYSHSQKILVVSFKAKNVQTWPRNYLGIYLKIWKLKFM